MARSGFEQAWQSARERFEGRAGGLETSGERGMVDHADLREQQPDGGLVALDRGRVVVLAGLEDEPGVADGVEPVGQDAADHRFEAEHAGDGYGACEFSNPDDVFNGEKRTAGRAGGVEVEQEGRAAAAQNGVGDLVGEFSLFALFGADRFAPLGPGKGFVDRARGPQAVQVGLDEADAIAERFDVAGEGDELASEAAGLALHYGAERLEDAYGGVHAAGFVAVLAGDDDDGRAPVATRGRRTGRRRVR